MYSQMNPMASFSASNRAQNNPPHTRSLNAMLFFSPITILRYHMTSIVRSSVFVLIGILLAFTWGLPGFAKLFGSGVPNWFNEQFGKTFLATFPGMTVSFYSIAVLECIAAVLAAASLLRGEFLPGRSATILKITLLLSMAIFVQLGFGRRLIESHDDAHSLFMYATATLVLLMATLRLDEIDSQRKKA